MFKFMEQKNILISPLDWGIGHAARCIPIINNFINQGCSITIFASEEINNFFKIRFGENIFYINDKSKPFSYNKKISLLKIFHFALKMKKNTIVENRLCAELCENKKYDLIISDNRYGFKHDNIKSVLITLQLMPIPPFIFRFSKPIIKNYLKKIFSSFSEVWVPDYKKPDGLAGKLSHVNFKIPNLKYINPLSRFEKLEINSLPIDENKILLISSGPKNHRKIISKNFASIFEKIPNINVFIIGTTPFETKNKKINTIESPSDNEIFELITTSSIIIAGAGYSTIMDLYALKRSAILVPTRGQTEQIYLSKLHEKNMLIARKFKTLKIMLENLKETSYLLKKKEENFNIFN